MYRIKILFTVCIIFFITCIALAEDVHSKAQSGNGGKAGARVPGSGGGKGDGSGRLKKDIKKEKFKDTLTYEERLANRGKGSGGLGLGRMGKPPKGKKGEGTLIKILAPEETKELLEMLTVFYKKKYKVKFQIQYFSNTDSKTDNASRVEDTKNIDLLITDNSQFISKLDSAARVKSKIEHFGHRALFVGGQQTAKLKSLKQLCSGNFSSLAVLLDSGNQILPLLEKVLKRNGVWDKCNSKIQQVKNTENLISVLKSKQADIAFAYNASINRRKDLKPLYELKKSEYQLPELPILLLNGPNSQFKPDVQDFYTFLNGHYADKFFKTFGYLSTWKK